MKGFIASALLGVLLASPVAAQIAGSGQRTPEAEAQLAKIRKAPPKPAASPRAEPRLSGAPKGGNRASTMKIVDVRAAKGLAGTSGIRVFRGTRVSVVRSGVRKLQKTSPATARRSQMKLIRIGASPSVTYTAYGVDLAERHEEMPVRPPTIRINP
jgi:hypothetical protein